MLSGLLTRKRRLKSALKSAPIHFVEVETKQSSSESKDSPRSTTTSLKNRLKPDTVKPTTPTPAIVESKFIGATNILISPTLVEVVTPQLQKGILWDRWENVTKEFPNTEIGLQQFVSTLMELSAEINNKIDKYDNASSQVQTLTSAVASIIQIVQTVLAAVQSLNGSSYIDFQISLSLVVTVISLLMKPLNDLVIDLKTDSITQGDNVSALLNSQNVNAPTQQPSQILISELSATLPSIAEEKHATELPQPVQPTLFVPVDKLLTIVGSEVDYILPVRSSNFLYAHWEEKSNKTVNTPDKFNLFKITLFKSHVSMDNDINTTQNQITRVQNMTAYATIVIGGLQTAVVGTQKLDQVALQIFQIIVSALNASLAVFAKTVSSSLTDKRNQELAFSADIVEVLDKQIAPVTMPSLRS